MKTIRNIASFLLILTIVALLTSCGKDPQIYGKWKVVDFTVTNGEQSQNYNLSLFTTKEITLEFTKDNRFIFALDGEEAEPKDFVLHGNELVLKEAYTEQIQDPEGYTENHYDVTGTINTLTKTDMSVVLYPPEEALASMEMDQSVYFILNLQRL